MAKKKETIQDILDRINEDIETIREKVEELESENDSDFDDEDEDEEQFGKRQPEFLILAIPTRVTTSKSSSLNIVNLIKLST